MAKARIMIVEDEGLTGAYIQKTLEGLGYTVTSLEFSAEEAIEKAGIDRPDLILMDIKLQGEMDGIEAAFEIRRGYDIPVVYLTAHSDEAMLERAKITEPFGYVIKPFESRELYSNIEMALYKHSIEKKLKALAHYDTLTGLPNRTLFYDRFRQALKQAKRNQKVIALLALDLDGFKCINDDLGHDVGDLVLKEVAQRLYLCIRETDTVARFGGDEFTIIYTNLKDPSDVNPLASKIIIAIGRPFQFGDSHCSLGVSIGISFYPSDGENVESLLKKADVAMYRAKENGKNNFQYFNNISAENKCYLNVVIELAIMFVVNQKGVWDHNTWIEFLMGLKRNGVSLSNMMETHIGFLLEVLKQLYCLSTPLNADIEGTLFNICAKITTLLTENNCIWSSSQREALLHDIEVDGILLTEKKIHVIGKILEAVKSLYIIISLKS
ncbi:MAG: diguanylate cyclase [Nitrospirae bacterium]|nr:diguanylate cyclase [Nitrospirota bacterium]